MSLNELELQTDAELKRNAAEELMSNATVRELMEKHGAILKEIKIITNS